MKKSTAIGIAAVSVAGAAAIALGAVSNWYRNWNVKTWFGRGGDTQTEQPIKPAEPDNNKPVSNDGAIITDGESKGIQLLSAKLPVAAYSANGITEQADTAFVLTATIEPSQTTNKSVDWTVNWVNANSEWATGKAVTDYVTVTPTSDGALTANVVCKQAFGEQITVICASQENSEVNASCTVDYTEKVTGISEEWGYFSYGGYGPMVMFSEDNVAVITFIDDDHPVTFSVDKVLTTVGTIKDSYTGKLEVTPVQEFLDLMPSFTTPGTYSQNWVFCGGNISSPNWFFTDSFWENVFGGKAVIKTPYFYNASGNSDIINQYGCMLFKFSVTGKYSSYEVTYKVRIDQSALSVSATSVSLNNSSIVF